ncbi:MAG: aldose 1-epimerase [Alphaproteobacteria bacterium]|nr:aldose 1-epimerase [Alphaproteobacteria bacterium]
MGGPITLVAGACEAVVEPGYGGRITAFRHGGVDLFVPIADGSRDLGVSLSGGCFPLVPWSNRLRDGALSAGDRTIRLPATEDGRPHAIHGHGWRRCWTVLDRGEGYLAMAFAHPAGEEGWPWTYAAEQRVTLSPDGLAIALSVTNRGDTPMPVGLGLHPYLPRAADTWITFEAATAWPPVEAAIFPTGAAPLPAGLDARDGIPLPLGLDQGFGGWGGVARVDWPDRGRALTVTADPALRHLIVYTPPDRPFFCVEPVSHAIDAANLAARGVSGTGHRTLAAGETLAVTARYKVEVL